MTRTLTYVTTSDLGISNELALELAEYMDVSYGDAALTLVLPELFVRAHEDCTSAFDLPAIPAEYVAFIG